MGGTADRGPRRRARPAAAVAHRARGRHRQLGHHQEDPRGQPPSRARQTGRDQPPATSRSPTPPSPFDNRQAKLKASLNGYDQSLSRRLQPGPRRHPDQGRRRHGERHLRRHPLPQPRHARPHRRRAGRPGQQGLHPQGHRAPPQRPPARRLRLGAAPPGRTWASTSRSTRPAPSSGASCRWCRRSTPTTSTR